MCGSLRLSLILLAFCSRFWVEGSAEVGSNRHEELLSVEKQLLDQMVDYSSVLQQKISLMRRYITLMRQKQQQAEPDWEQYLANPLHSYSLIHHMHFDWTNWRRLMEQPLGREQLSKIRELLPKIPKTEYWNAMEEIINVPMTEVQFDPLESLQLALYAYDQDRLDLAEKWLNATLSGQKQLSPSKKELYNVLQGVEQSQVEKLHEKVQALNGNQSSQNILYIFIYILAICIPFLN